jgi:ADP-dependent NAD(P)H-hydrate dehydratase / NAD(P)H-hydrate epimerase
MLPLSEVRILDKNAEALGMPVARLMEGAGRAVAEEARALTRPRASIVVLCGPGNNGGDGAVAARLLAKDRRVRVLLALPRRQAHAMLQQQLRRLAGVKVEAAPGEAAVRGAVEKADLVVDALLGAGLQGTLREPFRTWARVVDEHAKLVLSVDVPTGLGTDAAVEPDVTVAMHDAKDGMTQANSGRIVVRDIGIPPRAATHTGPGEMTLYPIPKPAQHKGQGGVVLVVGGGPYAGAPALTGIAALRAGADLAIVLAPAKAAALVQGFSPDLIVRPLEGDDLDLAARPNAAMLEEFLPRATAVCVGNGMGRAGSAFDAVEALLERAGEAKLPVVGDADALHAVGTRRLRLPPKTILTPHAGEFKALTGEALAPEEAQDKRAEQARAWAAKLGCTLVAKGHESVITDGQRVKLNSTGNPAMSHGGTGDVLAGVIGALASKGLESFDAARLGAWMAGRAGDLAFEEQRFGLLASDVAAALPAVMREQKLHWSSGWKEGDRGAGTPLRKALGG